MIDNYFVAAEGVLGLRTNQASFKWSFGTNTPSATRAEYDQCAVRVNLRVDDDIAPPEDANFGKYHYFQARPDGDEIYYTRPFMFGSKLRLKAKGLLSAEPSVSFNKNYLRFVTHRFMNVHSAGFIMTDLVGLLLLHRGLAPLHCSAFQYRGATIVVAAPPNTGKTLTTMTACMDRSARFLAEDLAVTDGETIYSAPWTSTFRFYRKIDKSWRSRMGEMLHRVFPPIELLPLRSQQPITRYVDPAHLLSESRATHLVILERGEERVESVDVETAQRKVRNLNRFEFNYARSPLLIAHEFFNPGMNIAAACETENNILRALVENVQSRLVVRTTDATRYSDLIIRAVDDAAGGKIQSGQAA